MTGFKRKARSGMQCSVCGGAFGKYQSGAEAAVGSSPVPHLLEGSRARSLVQFWLCRCPAVWCWAGGPVSPGMLGCEVESEHPPAGLFLHTQVLSTCSEHPVPSPGASLSSDVENEGRQGRRSSTGPVASGIMLAPTDHFPLVSKESS